MGGTKHQASYLCCIVVLTVVGWVASVQMAALYSVPCAATATAQREPLIAARPRLVKPGNAHRVASVPEDAGDIKLGWFGPSDPAHPTAGAMWQAASMAVEEANRSGGYQRREFRLVPSWSDNPWGTGIKGVTRLTYDEEVWAIAGAPDGPSAHLVEQVVAKAQLVFLNPVSTDRTASLANVPWIFSCAPGDDLLASALAAELVSTVSASATGDTGFAVVSCTDHDSRVFATELLKALSRLGYFPRLHLQFKPGIADFTEQLRGIKQRDFAALVLSAGPEDAARFLVAHRSAASAVPVFGGPAMGHQRFVESAGDAAEGVVFPDLWRPSTGDERAQTFARRFLRRVGTEADYTAAYTYDAMKLLIAAIRRAGLDRSSIRDAVRDLSPWPGVTGTITWDSTGQNQHPVHLGSIQNGRIVPK